MSHSYIARRRQCGCIVVARADRTAEPDWREDTAKELASWVRLGAIVERVPNEVVRAAGVGCRCGESGTLSGMGE